MWNCLECLKFCSIGSSFCDQPACYVSYFSSPSVDFSDQGQYECSASNGIGASKSLTITVQVLVFDSVLSNEGQKGSRKTNSRLPCLISGSIQAVLHRKTTRPPKSGWGDLHSQLQGQRKPTTHYHHSPVSGEGNIARFCAWYFIIRCELACV